MTTSRPGSERDESVAASGHRCQPPALGTSLTIPHQPDWTCAECGRVWRDMRTTNGVQWWAEVRGPKPTEADIARGEELAREHGW